MTKRSENKYASLVSDEVDEVQAEEVVRRALREAEEDDRSYKAHKMRWADAKNNGTENVLQRELDAEIARYAAVAEEDDPNYAAHKMRWADAKENGTEDVLQRELDAEIARYAAVAEALAAEDANGPRPSLGTWV